MSNSTTHDHEDQEEERDPHTDKSDDDGAPVPFAPDSDDKSPLGDTDEHSDA